MSDKLRFSWLLGLLLLVNVELRLMSHGRPVPPREDLARFPTELAGWSGKDMRDMTEGERRVLAADDYLWRAYERDGVQLGLFIAYYRSQKSGDTLHSPKNCLPGAGWEPIASGVVTIPRPGSAGSSFAANHYVIAKNGMQQEVLYWYQANQRAFASEYWGKTFLVWDAMTKNRTDGALIRITAPRAPGDGTTTRAMMDFAQALTGVLPQFLPN